MKEKKRHGMLMALSGNLLIIILAGAIGGLLVYYIDSNGREDKYRATAKIFVSNEDRKAEAEASYETQNDLVLAKDCSLILANRTVMTQVIVGLDLKLVYPDMRDVTAEALLDKVDACVAKGSRIIYLTVTDKNPSRAKGLADAISVAAVDYLKKSFNVKTAEVVESANMPVAPVKYNIWLKLLGGILAGLIISATVIIIISVWDKRIKNKNDVERLGIPMLAAIPVHEEVVLKSGSHTSQQESGKASSSEEKEE